VSHTARLGAGPAGQQIRSGFVPQWKIPMINELITLTVLIRRVSLIMLTLSINRVVQVHASTHLWMSAGCTQRCAYQKKRQQTLQHRAERLLVLTIGSAQFITEARWIGFLITVGSAHFITEARNHTVHTQLQRQGITQCTLHYRGKESHSAHSITEARNHTVHTY